MEIIKDILLHSNASPTSILLIWWLLWLIKLQSPSFWSALTQCGRLRSKAANFSTRSSMNEFALSWMTLQILVSKQTTMSTFRFNSIQVIIESLKLQLWCAKSNYPNGIGSEWRAKTWTLTREESFLNNLTTVMKDLTANHPPTSTKLTLTSPRFVKQLGMETG